MQRRSSPSVFSEGWALYAEQLAEEMGLYNGTVLVLEDKIRKWTAAVQ